VPTSDLLNLLDRWKPRRIIVVGDFILDRFIFGNAERLSPDAPVPVLAAERREHAAGGASNVCLDLAALRCKVEAVGVVGQDPHARTLRDALRDKGVNVVGLFTAEDRPTTVKHNFIGLAQHRHPQKMFRVDDESRDAVPAAVARKIINRVSKSIARADVLCLEDYHKGVLGASLCQSLIRLARKHKVPVLVDPAAISDFGKYRGATCITPNRTEAERATGMTIDGYDKQQLGRVARKLLSDLKLEAVLLTLDRHGMLLVRRGTGLVHVPTRARDVYDVTGAGDMVLAALAGAWANGADWQAAVELANVAAGLEVEKFGVVPIERDELLLAVLAEYHAELGKLRTLDFLLPELAAHRAAGKTIAFTNGCFDILHAGHIDFLRKAKASGDLLVVGLNTDASIRRLKGPDRPVNHEADRVMVLSELESIDYIVLFKEDTPMKLIKAIKPDRLVKGADYKKAEVVGHQVVQKHGGRVVLVPLFEGRSTTNIIRKVRG